MEEGIESQAGNDTIPYFVSWSGGKDCSLALYRASLKYGRPKFLLTMMTEGGQRSRSHGLSKELLEQQAECLDISILFYSASWDNYESVYLGALEKLSALGIKMGVFGDLKMGNDPKGAANRDWADKVCASQQMIAFEPLWDDTTESIIQDFFKVGFEATIIAVNQEKMKLEDLGKTLSVALIQEFADQKIDPLGEKGEYHTLVTSGPIFSRPLGIIPGEKVLKSGYWFLDIEVQPTLTHSF
jgi:diphthine-ammonia ligase